MRYLTAEEILATHDKLIEQIGGSLGVREENLLLSIAERPKTSFGGQEQFPTLFIKAAVYLESVATYHVFVDGNKRTALAVAQVFLAANGYKTVSLPIKETETFILAAARRQKNLEEIAAWLEKSSKKA
ncbi:MAG TPA: type II toxin-antitoxin system death-on-curing family toxin [Candidatus Paceibacterota bacterium]|nr:type II toxin-antitoxin system death-on-curing family toxin [Candidatus Paceibacterota bacterium]